MKKVHKTTRREFLKASALFGGMMFLPSCATNRVKGANGRMSIALIGVGGIGGYATECLRDVHQADIIAGCDVDDAQSAKNYNVLSKIQRFGNISKFKDYRVMLDKIGNDIDGVIISTPDHMHYPISSWCMERGIHTFCQKPLARTIWECREMDRLAKKYGVYTQMGNQGHTANGWRELREWYDAGILGKVEEVYIWTSRPARYWKQGKDVTRPQVNKKIPSTLDYDLWLGVAPNQPYSESFIPSGWRGIRDFGTGAIGDMGCHFMDASYSAFELEYPVSVVAQTDEFNDYSWPYSSTLKYEFASKFGKNGKIYMHWYDGYRKPKYVKGLDSKFINSRGDAMIFVCEKETVITDEYCRRLTLASRDRMIELTKAKAFPTPTLERSVSPMNAHKEFVLMTLDGRKPHSNFSYSSKFTEMALIGMIAMTQNGKQLRYNPETMTFKDNKDADKYVRSLYEYRKEFIA